VTRCHACGRENEGDSRFCQGCGQPVVQGAARLIPVDGTWKLVTSPAGNPAVSSETGGRRAYVSAASHAAATPLRLALLDEGGAAIDHFALDGERITIGRDDGDLLFPSDVFVSPVHAMLSRRDGQLFLRDLGARNGTWLFVDAPYRLQDGDAILIGSQVIRFRRLGYPGPHPPEADQTRRLGSLTPGADIAVLSQLRSDGSARDTVHLSPGRGVKIGREHGDWVFPYDKTMSGRHAEIRSEDLEFIVLDDQSRNGVAIAVRGERPVKAGQRILIGDQTLRVESL
jgi:pSer/pThr/pTyr-binding forkhead associated (FHA) protein